MFGYVRPVRGNLEEAAFARYQAAYCGLCERLCRRYGFAARFTVNYDLAFLSILLGSLQTQREYAMRRCPARLCKKKNCLLGGGEQDFCADLCVILYYHKLRDSVSDETFLRSLGARLCARFLRRSYRKAAALRPDEDRLVRENLAALSVLEKEHCASVDRTADAFASILRAGAQCAGQGSTRRILEQLLYHIGRYIYLTDALDDLKKDAASGAYNVLMYRYTVTDGVLQEADKHALLATVDASIGLSAAAFELLAVQTDREILENVIYQGLPAVLKSVSEGTFHPKKKNRSAK